MPWGKDHPSVFERILNAIIGDKSYYDQYKEYGHLSRSVKTFNRVSKEKRVGSLVRKKNPGLFDRLFNNWKRDNLNKRLNDN